MTDWQPIETAPRDEYRPILTYSNGVITTVKWHVDKVGGGHWVLSEPGVYGEDFEWWPTHWMPLPEPPGEGEG